MGLLPSISSVLSIGLEGGPAALVWGWILASILSFVLVQVLHFLEVPSPPLEGYTTTRIIIALMRLECH